MLALSPCQRKAFQVTAPCLLLPGGGRRGWSALVFRLLAPLFAAAILACLFLAPRAGADVVIQSGDTVTRLRDDGSSGEAAQAAPDNELFGTGILPPRSGQLQNGTDGNESLPYGIVPEVHIPWHGGNWQTPGQTPGGDGSGRPGHNRPGGSTHGRPDGPEHNIGGPGGHGRPDGPEHNRPGRPGAPGHPDAAHRPPHVTGPPPGGHGLP